MLKFSGWSCLISDANKVWVSRSFQHKLAASTLNEFTLENVTAALSVRLNKQSHLQSTEHLHI